MKDEVTTEKLAKKRGELIAWWGNIIRRFPDSDDRVQCIDHIDILIEETIDTFDYIIDPILVLRDVSEPRCMRTQCYHASIVPRVITNYMADSTKYGVADISNKVIEHSVLLNILGDDVDFHRLYKHDDSLCLGLDRFNLVASVYQSLISGSASIPATTIVDVITETEKLASGAGFSDVKYMQEMFVYVRNIIRSITRSAQNELALRDFMQPMGSILQSIIRYIFINVRQLTQDVDWSDNTALDVISSVRDTELFGCVFKIVNGVRNPSTKIDVDTVLRELEVIEDAFYPTSLGIVPNDATRISQLLREELHVQDNAGTTKEDVPIYSEWLKDQLDTALIPYVIHTMYREDVDGVAVSHNLTYSLCSETVEPLESTEERDSGILLNIYVKENCVTPNLDIDVREYLCRILSNSATSPERLIYLLKKRFSLIDEIVLHDKEGCICDCSTVVYCNHIVIAYGNHGYVYLCYHKNRSNNSLEKK